MERPRISDEMVEKIERQADGILGEHVDAEELKFERQLDIVFEAARERAAEPAGTDGDRELDGEGLAELDYQDDADDEPDVVESLIVGDLE